MEAKYSTCRPPRPPRVPAPIQEAQAHPHCLLPVPAAQAGAGLREEPVRGGPGAEGAGQDAKLVRNPGNNIRVHSASAPRLYLYSFVCSCLSLNHLALFMCSHLHGYGHNYHLAPR